MPEPRPKSKNSRGVRYFLPLLYGLPVLVVLGFCGFLGYARLTHKGPPVRKISAAPFLTVKIDALTARLFAQGNALSAAGNDLFIEFRDDQGKLVDVGEVSFVLALQMPGSVMHSIGIVNRTATPGQYRTTLDPGLAGEWKAKLSYTGPRGKADADFAVKVM